MYMENINVKKFIKMSATEIECLHSVHYFYTIQIHNITSHNEQNVKHHITVHSKELHC